MLRYRSEMICFIEDLFVCLMQLLFYESLDGRCRMNGSRRMVFGTALGAQRLLRNGDDTREMMHTDQEEE
jgi:hypothetical protein